MKVNITRHELVPKHTILTDEQKKQLLKRYNLQEKHLPRIQKSDPIARYYGLERRSVGSQQCSAYRRHTPPNAIATARSSRFPSQQVNGLTRK